MRSLQELAKKFAGQLVRDLIVKGIARGLFVTAWADDEQENKRTHSGENIFNIAPNTSPEALFAARELAHRIEQLNNKSLEQLLDMASEADGTEADPEEFGQYLAYGSLGIGTNWFDDHASFELKLPYFEFYFGGPTVN